MVKLLVPQVNSFGVSEDYNNELQLVYSWSSSQLIIARGNVSEREVKMREKLMGFHSVKPMLRYSDRYSSDEFIDPVNAKNKDCVLSIDALVDEVNSLISVKNEDFRKYYSLIDEIHLFLTGKSLKKYL